MHLCEPKQCPGVKPEYPLSEVPNSTWPARAKVWNQEKMERRVPPPTFLFVSLHLFVFLGKKSLKNKSKSSIV